mmetsp:Transcript_35996/g.69018  ORF Transcript_35996/g.69018 Transcript_35996/m.69018 type:complete len:286 (+) Transcript_35996:805-1662(+)
MLQRHGAEVVLHGVLPAGGPVLCVVVVLVALRIVMRRPSSRQGSVKRLFRDEEKVGVEDGVDAEVPGQGHDLLGAVLLALLLLRVQAPLLRQRLGAHSLLLLLPLLELAALGVVHDPLEDSHALRDGLPALLRLGLGLGAAPVGAVGVAHDDGGGGRGLRERAAVKRHGLPGRLVPPPSGLWLGEGLGRGLGPTHRRLYLVLHLARLEQLLVALLRTRRSGAGRRLLRLLRGLLNGHGLALEGVHLLLVQRGHVRDRFGRLLSRPRRCLHLPLHLAFRLLLMLQV